MFLLLLLAGCHPKKGDVYISTSTSERIKVVYRDDCQSAAEYAVSMNERLAEIAEQEYTASDVSGLPDDLDCIVYSSSEDLSSGGVAISFEVMSVQFLEANYQR